MHIFVMNLENVVLLTVSILTLSLFIVCTFLLLNVQDDTSVTRTDAQFKVLFKKAGLSLISEKLQTGFPKCLFPVRMYALIPDDRAFQ